MLTVLKKSELFSELDDKELPMIEAITEPLQVAVGDLVCKQGKKQDKIYIVEDGSMAIVLEVGPLAQRQVQSARNFGTFGWSAMVEPYIYTASVRATVTSRLLALKANRLREICQNRPDIGCKIYRAIARVVAKRLRESYEQLIGVTDEEVE
jgi:CRP/FNR family cyclic AMP-dependent transcriptional regulator